MQIIRKHYRDLTADELYGILRLRAEVFVVEQVCPYQDLDGNDRDAIHLFAIADSKSSETPTQEAPAEIVACLRIFRKDKDTATIGRVVTSKKVRGTGLAKKMMLEGLSIAREAFGPLPVVIHAQCYAIGFYEKCGFEVSSGEFLEDDIPHVEMTFTP